MAAKSDDDYRAEDDHRTLTRAEEIRMDAARMKGVRKHHTRVNRSLTRVGRAIGAKRSR